MDASLTAQTGRTTGSRSSNRLRAEGKVPGVVYGLGNEPVAVAVEWPELRKVLITEAGMNALIDLTVDGETNLTMIKELQRHPVRRDVTHVDFLLVDRNKSLVVDVPIVLIGDSEKIEREQGILDQSMHMLTGHAQPGKIPNQLEVDGTEMTIGDVIRVGDIALPDGVTTDIDPEEPVIVGSATRAAIEDEAAEGEAAEGAEGEGAEAAAEGGEGEAASEDGEG
jgi:large subunit ribosomal protein L25